ncbi:MAG: glycine--tRNA ligase subunit beta [Thiolinea sp.]
MTTETRDFPGGDWHRRTAAESPEAIIGSIYRRYCCRSGCSRIAGWGAGGLCRAAPAGGLDQGRAAASAGPDCGTQGAALQAAYDAEGQPTKAAQGFARSCGVEVADLQQQETDKGNLADLPSATAGTGHCRLVAGYGQ